MYIDIVYIIYVTIHVSSSAPARDLADISGPMGGRE